MLTTIKNNWISVGMDVHNMIKTLTKSLPFLNPIIVIIIVKIITKHFHYDSVLQGQRICNFLIQNEVRERCFITVTKITLLLPYSSSAQCDIYCCQTGWPTWPSVCFIEAWQFISFWKDFLSVLRILSSVDYSLFRYTLYLPIQIKSPKLLE